MPYVQPAQGTGRARRSCRAAASPRSSSLPRVRPASAGSWAPRTSWQARVCEASTRSCGMWRNFCEIYCYYRYAGRSVPHRDRPTRIP
eukprot:7379833-Prymnesium_polylepis.1